MPIRFETQAPFDAAAAYGAAQAKMGPSIGDVTDLVKTRQQAINQQMAISSEFASRDADRRQSGAELQRRLQYGQQAHQDDINAAADRANAEMAQSANNNLADAQVRIALKNMDFTHADKMEMDKLNYAQSKVSQMLNSGEISPVEAKAYLLQVRTGLNPLESKLQATKVKQAKQAADEQLQWSQMLAGIDSANGATLAQHAPSRIDRADDGSARGIFLPGGKYQAFPQQKPAAEFDVGKAMSTAASIAAKRHPKNPNPITGEDSNAAARVKAEQEIFDALKTHAGVTGNSATPATPGPGTPPQPGATPPPTQPPPGQVIGQALQQAYQQFPDDPKKAAELVKKNLPPEAAAAYQPPYDPKTKIEDLTFDQQTARQSIDDLTKLLPADAEQGMKERIGGLSEQMLKLHSQYGSAAQMPPEVKASYANLKNEARNIATNARGKDVTRNTAIAQQLLDSRMPWEQAAAAMKAQGINPGPLEKDYKAGLDYQDRLEKHTREMRSKLTGRKPV